MAVVDHHEIALRIEPRPAIYLYREMFKYHQFGMASATGCFMLLMSRLIALPYLRQMYREVMRGA